MMRKTRQFPTTLGYALLGVVQGNPGTGYSIRKIFETSPIGRFSDSPGSIYPALKKLEAHGLIEGRSATGTSGKVLHVTAKGKRVFRRWLSEPAAADEIAILRFAFLDLAGDRALSLRTRGRSRMHSARSSRR